jgi:hypothetical protein
MRDRDSGRKGGDMTPQWRDDAIATFRQLFRIDDEALMRRLEQWRAVTTKRRNARARRKKVRTHGH